MGKTLFEKVWQQQTQVCHRFCQGSWNKGDTQKGRDWRRDINIISLLGQIVNRGDRNPLLQLLITTSRQQDLKTV